MQFTEDETSSLGWRSFRAVPFSISCSCDSEKLTWIHLYLIKYQRGGEDCRSGVWDVGTSGNVVDVDWVCC